MSVNETPRGLTPNELAKVLRVSPDRIRNWIARGELAAVNTAASRCGRPRFVILPDALAAFVEGRRAGPPPKPPKRKKRTNVVDYYSN